jgi:hypothetical protein
MTITPMDKALGVPVTIQKQYLPDSVDYSNAPRNITI